MQPRGRTRSVAPVTVLVALLFVAAAALRGYVPGAGPAPREPSTDDPVAFAVVVVLLVAAVAVVVVAVIVRLRLRGAAPPRPAGRSDWLRGDRGKPTWRAALVAFGLLLGWLLLSMLLGRLGGTSNPGTLPEAPATSTPTPGRAVAPPPPSEPAGHLLGFFAMATVVFLVVIVVGSVIAARRQHRPGLATAAAAGDDTAAAEPPAGAESLARAAEVGLAEVGDLSRDPRRAIIACYAAMENQLALVPDAAPRDFDTASEVLARAVEHHALTPDSATQLVDLFDEARFSPHVMNEGHRDVAVAVLTEVLDELRSHP